MSCRTSQSSGRMTMPSSSIGPLLAGVAAMYPAPSEDSWSMCSLILAT
jgi:hypothetical protein